MLPSRLEVKVEGDEHPDSMVLPFACQTEAIRLLCFLSAPPVHASRKSESGGVVMPISMRGGGGGVGVGQRGRWCAEQWRRDVVSCSIQRKT